LVLVASENLDRARRAKFRSIFAKGYSQDLEHPRPEAGVLVVAIKRREPAHHGVLEGIRRVRRLPDQPASVGFQVALDWLVQRQETIRIGCRYVAHDCLLWKQSRRTVVLLQKSGDGLNAWHSAGAEHLGKR